jgi:hypothetical protein
MVLQMTTRPNQKVLPHMLSSCPECSSLWERLCWASTIQFRLEEEVESARIAGSDAGLIAGLDFRADFAARQVTLLSGQVRAHMLTHRLRSSSFAATGLVQTRVDGDSASG